MLKYDNGGIETLMAQRSGQGRKRSIPNEVSSALEAELTKREGFKSYGEIQDWLEQEHDLTVRYGTVHLHVHYRLGAKLKRPRPVSVKQDEQEVWLLKKPSLPG
jgi:transposase